ncbi:MAG TPA: phosphate ABC transporter ATP-binding protein, partial [Blastocatellia bacterium]|nr:phosphate ABC transporter ATP-binding protein [Blastocatellia bacterium]
MESKISISDLNFFYGKEQALFDIALEIPHREVV